MKIIKTLRGFELLVNPKYPSGEDDTMEPRLVQQSSAAKFEPPGSSYLWVGEDHHLSIPQVKQLIRHLQAWVDTGSLHIASKERKKPARLDAG